MNILKKIKNSFFLVLVVLLTISCREDVNNSVSLEVIDESKDNFTGDIKGLYYGNFKGEHYRVIEVEGHKYLTQSAGAIIHLESCFCKNE